MTTKSAHAVEMMTNAVAAAFRGRMSYRVARRRRVVVAATYSRAELRGMVHALRVLRA